MLNPRPECTRYYDQSGKRNIHLADRALASTQHADLNMMNEQHTKFMQDTNMITSVNPSFTMGVQSGALQNSSFLDRGGVNTRVQKSVNNQQMNGYYQMGRIGTSSENMMNITRPMDTRLQYNSSKPNFDTESRAPIPRAMPKY